MPPRPKSKASAGASPKDGPKPRARRSTPIVMLAPIAANQTRADCGVKGAGARKATAHATPGTKSPIAKNAQPSLRASKKSARLSDKQALAKYEGRLRLLPVSAFAPLANRWASVYERSLCRRKTFEPGVFSIPWTSVLSKIAAEKGVHIVGLLPHYHSRDALTGAIVFDKRNDIQLATSDTPVGESVRVLVGPQPGRRLAADETDEASVLAKMAFSPKDRKRDDLWEALCVALATLPAHR